jgi:transposase
VLPITTGQRLAVQKLCPRTIQSGAIQRGGKTGALGEAAAAAAKTDTYLGERYRRIVERS